MNPSASAVPPVPDPKAQAAARAACDEMRSPDAMIETTSIPPITPSGADRFLSKVAFPANADHCQVWTAYTNRGGYGQFGIGGRMFFAHRVAFAWRNGRIRPGMTLDHVCRNRACVNPDHLEPVTSRENLLRGETIAADQVSRDFCPRGHELVGTNLQTRALRRAQRECRICAVVRTRAGMIAFDRGSSLDDQNAAGHAAVAALTGAETPESLGLGPDSIHYALELVPSNLRFPFEIGDST